MNYFKSSSIFENVTSKWTSSVEKLLFLAKKTISKEAIIKSATVVSHYTLGLFWRCCHFVIGYYKVAQEAVSEFVPQNSLIAQFDTTLT